MEVDHPAYEQARAVLARYAEIEKSPEHVHTYRLSDLALWNAAGAGASAEEIVSGLRAISRFELPSVVEHEVRDRMARWGVCTLHDHPTDPAQLRLSVREAFVRDRLGGDRRTAELLRACPDGFLIDTVHRGAIKRALLEIGYPVHDRAQLIPGAPLSIAVREDAFSPYAYQRASVRAFVESGSHGVVVLPCGAGKTVVAMLAMAELGVRTLVITTGREAAHQWKREIVGKTTLVDADVALYAADRKAIGPVTLTSYSMLAKKGGTGPTKHVHFDRLASEPWGLVVYDEVHLLPAPVFRLTAELQARRRLGLTATLVREDGREGDVFALIGPKRFDVPWRELEKSGHIAAASCFEVRLPLPEALRLPYATAELREQPRIAGENPLKLSLLGELAERHAGDRMLVLGSYLEPLAAAGKLLGAPVVTGETPHDARERAYRDFRSGAIRRLVLSRPPAGRGR